MRVERIRRTANTSRRFDLASGAEHAGIATAKTFGQITVKFAVTENGFEVDKACKIESDCHRFFRKNSVSKEVFRVPYDEAKARLEKYASVIEFNELEGDT